MDPAYLKIKIDIKSEHDDYKKKYEYKRKELKRQEVKKIFENFKEYFKQEGHYKFKENEHSITAEYRDHAIVLDLDIYNNVDNADFKLTGTIATFEDEHYEFTAEGVQNTDKVLPPPDISEQERMIYDTKFYKDFLDGEVEYTFNYRITGREETYLNMNDLLLAL